MGTQQPANTASNRLNYSRISAATAATGAAPVDRSYVSKVLRGKANATAAVIRRIATAMGVEAHELMKLIGKDGAEDKGSAS